MNNRLALGYKVCDEFRLLRHDDWKLFFSKGTHTKKRRLKVLSERQNHRCAYCGKWTWLHSLGESGHANDEATTEHIIQQSDGGTWHINNLVMACMKCNSGRGNIPAYAFWLMKNGTKLKFSLEGKM